MFLETSNKLWDFELLDSGNGFRLEKWGKVILIRPDPQAIWQPALPKKDWDKAWAIYKTPNAENHGKWEIKQPVPKPWIINFNNTKFLLKLSPFKHTGIFAEQAAQWSWMTGKLNGLKVKSHQVIKPEHGLNLKNFQLDDFQLAKRFKILNLFAYTGGATMILAKAGCHVTHVDASKPAITWANENYHLNFPSVENGRDRSLPGNVRWILDDCAKFVKREIKRGNKYDGIIMDPPAFGHSPTGNVWKFNNHIPGLLEDCVKLLSNNAQFLVIHGYATNSSALALNNLLEDTTKNLEGKIEYGELCLKHSLKAGPAHGAKKSGRMLSTGIFARWGA